MTTLAASLSVALENVRLIEETRQRSPSWRRSTRSARPRRASSISTALIELVGEQMRETFDADICYVALHDAGRADRVPVLLRERRAGAQEPFAFGEGLTSRILVTREPLLLNRGGLGAICRATASGRRRSRISACRSCRRRGDRRDQRPEHDPEGRFGEADVRLLSTIAANVGVAIQNARLYQEAHRRGDEMAALAEVGQEISATLDVDTVLEQIGRRVETLLAADTTALFLRNRMGPSRPGSPSASSPMPCGPTRSSRAKGSSATSSARPDPGIRQRHRRRPPDRRHPRDRGARRRPRAADGRAVDRPRRVIGHVGVWRTGGDPFVQADLDFLVGLARQAQIAIENARLYRDAQEATAPPRPRTRRRARSSRR